MSTGGVYSKASEKGVISNIPEILGLCVYMQGYIGVYIGNGWVIECAGRCGVVKTSLKDSGATHWRHWIKCPFIQYQECGTSNDDSR